MFVSRRHLAIGLAAVGFLAGGTSVAAARPQVPAEVQEVPYSGVVRACEDPMATGYIQGAFASTEAEYWNSGLTIVGFENIREIGMRSNGLDYIPRRYCMANAVMSDHKIRSVSYSIIEDGGSIGFTDNVNWCVNGLDRQNAYSPACKMARP